MRHHKLESLFGVVWPKTFAKLSRSYCITNHRIESVSILICCISLAASVSSLSPPYSVARQDIIPEETVVSTEIVDSGCEGGCHSWDNRRRRVRGHDGGSAGAPGRGGGREALGRADSRVRCNHARTTFFLFVTSSVVSSFIGERGEIACRRNWFGGKKQETLALLA